MTVIINVTFYLHNIVLICIREIYFSMFSVLVLIIIMTLLVVKLHSFNVRYEP